MLKEYFVDPPRRHEPVRPVACMPGAFCRQERDWTCSAACVRTLASGLCGVPSEDVLVAGAHLEPGPQYSGGIMRWPGLRELKDVEWRFGEADPESAVLDSSDVWAWLRDGWRVMANWMMSYDHWCVFFSYIPFGSDEEDLMFFFDPYYGDVRSVRASDFDVMWKSGSPGGPVHDYVLCRRIRSIA